MSRDECAAAQDRPNDPMTPSLYQRSGAGDQTARPDSNPPAPEVPSAACDHCDDTGEVLEPSRTPEETDHMIPCANCQDDPASQGRSHFTVDGFLEDKLGFFVAECDCGWTTPPGPDEETAADFLMQHAYEQGILDERNGRVPR